MLQRMCLPLVCLALWAPAAGAADKPGGQKAKPVYEVHLHHAGPDNKTEVTLDMSDAAHAERLASELKAGNVHELKLKEEVNLLALKADLGLWSVVVFIILFWGLQRYAWPLILDGLQSREANIASALSEAERTRAEAARLEKQFQEQLAQANDRVRQMLDDARRDATAATEAMMTKARGEIKLDRDRMLRELETAKDAALKEMWDQSVELASLMSAKAIKQNLDVAAHKRLFGEALQELGQAAEKISQN
ncbi:MAG TPA: F0F1 ATP synthase subunit B [Gemmatales bacterium]|nr:F0F1 ATP synthase subunit B [Gemmatales bacterium]